MYCRPWFLDASCFTCFYQGWRHDSKSQHGHNRTRPPTTNVEKWLTPPLNNWGVGNQFPQLINIYLYIYIYMMCNLLFAIDYVLGIKNGIMCWILLYACWLAAFAFFSFHFFSFSFPFTSFLLLIAFWLYQHISQAQIVIYYPVIKHFFE